MTSLRARLTLFSLLATLLLIFAAGFLLEHLLERQLEASLDATLYAKAESMMALTEQEDGKVLVEFAEVYLPELTSRELIEIRLASGRVLAHSSALGKTHLSADGKISMTPRFSNVRLPDDRPGRQIQVDFLPLLEGEEDSVLAVVAPPEAATSDPSRQLTTVLVAVDRGETLALIERFRYTLALIALLLLSALALLLPWLVRRGLRPLFDLGAAVQKMEVSNLGEQLELENPPHELQPLLELLDDLSARLGRSFERERLFSSNVAHELRTPIAELRNLAEVALRFPPSAEQSATFYRDALATTLRMERTAEHLLALARLEEAHADLELAPLPLRRAAEAVLLRRAAVAAYRSNIPEEASVRTNASLFDLLLDNLIANAFANRTAESVVEIAALPSATGWLFSCRNHSENLAQADLDHFFERFWRKDGSRTDARHSGLGLALARSIAEALGIGIALSLEGGVFEIRLDIPAAR